MTFDVIIDLIKNFGNFIDDYNELIIATNRVEIKFMKLQNKKLQHEVERKKEEVNNAIINSTQLLDNDFKK